MGNLNYSKAGDGIHSQRIAQLHHLPIIGQVSRSIEPWSTFIRILRKLKQQSKSFGKTLKTKVRIHQVWKEIRDMDEFIQGLDFLSEHEKNVFKTYSEIDQLDIIYQAANRQNHIDQGQSLNIMIHPEMSPKEINKIHVTAWKLNIKSLYYQHSMNAAQKFKQKKECESCEG